MSQSPSNGCWIDTYRLNMEYGLFSFQNDNSELNKKNMKKHLRSILLAIISMIVPLGLQAQEDVTATYLLNPSFEEGVTYFHDITQTVPGWNLDAASMGVSYRNDDADGTKDGTYIFGIWDPSNIGDFQISQTVKNLPAGTYVISCLMTVPEGDNTTQRLYATSNSAGTKALYFGSTSLGVVPGESYEYKGNAVDGNGAGPFHPMSLMINVAAGDSLVLGVRTNGQKSTILPLSTVGGAGWFKVDNFKLSYIADLKAYTKAEIQAYINTIKSISLDSIPGGYGAVITAKIAEADNVVATQNNIDSLQAYSGRIKGFITTMATAKTKFLALQALLMKAESLTSTTSYPNKAALETVFTASYEVYLGLTSLVAEFDAAYTALDAAIIAYTKDVVPENLALIGTASTSFVSGWEKLSAVNDGFEPTSSVDRSHKIYGNWNGDGDYGKVNWVQYEWPYYHTITGVSVYWFTDFGGLSQPNFATVEYWENNTWKLVGNIDTLMNKWNTLPVSNIKSNKVRVNFSSLTSTGIVEFKVMGFRKIDNDESDYKRFITDELALVDAIKLDSVPGGYGAPTAAIKTEGATELASGTLSSLKAYYTKLTDFHHLLDSAGGVFINYSNQLLETKAMLDSTNWANKSILQTAYDNGLVVKNAATSMIAEYITSLNDLKKALLDYASTHVVATLSAKATVTTSLCSSWESLAAINDGFDPTSSADNTHKKYGNWNGSNALVHWVQYEWAAPQKITSIAVYWFTDGGGLLFPDSTSVDYYNGTEWQVLGPIGALGDQYNTMAVEIMASKLRLSMRSAVATGIIEFKVRGYEMSAGVAAVKQGNAVNVYPTMVKRGASVNIDFAKDLVKPATVEMYSISGQKVFNTSVSGRTSSVNVPGSLASGIYLMVFNTPEGKMFKKIVVE